MKPITILMPELMHTNIERVVKAKGYASKADFIRIAVRAKLEREGLRVE